MAFRDVDPDTFQIVAAGVLGRHRLLLKHFNRLTGALTTLWQGLSAVGNDPYPYSSVRVPTLVFDDVQFSGV